MNSLVHSTDICVPRFLTTRIEAKVNNTQFLILRSILCVCVCVLLLLGKFLAIIIVSRRQTHK